MPISPPCLIGMEACVGAHHLSRRLKALGHDARLMPAKYVRPYSKGQKNDFRDAEAIAEAVRRPTMKFVATKTADQLDLQVLHRVRERLVSQRTGIIRSINSPIFTGGTTSVCIESTLRDAMFRDYTCLLLADCTAEPGLAGINHDASQLAVQGQFGWVSQSAQFIAALEEQRVPSPDRQRAIRLDQAGKFGALRLHPRTDGISATEYVDPG